MVVLHKMLEDGFVIGINAVAAEPFDEKWLGRIITEDVVDELGRLAERYGINPAGEGGEYETFVLDSPIHKKKLVVAEPRVKYEKHAGVIDYRLIRLAQKAPGQKPSQPFVFKELKI